MTHMSYLMFKMTIKYQKVNVYTDAKIYGSHLSDKLVQVETSLKKMKKYIH